MFYTQGMVLLWWLILATFLLGRVAGLGCQHSCDCDFAWDGSDKDLTLRYEVMSGLVGAFSPLLLAGLGYLIYKRCCKPGVASLPGTAAPMATAYPDGPGGGGWRGGSGGGGGGADSWRGGYNGNNGGGGGGGGGGVYPTSLYGESEDDLGFNDSPSQVQSQGRGGGYRPGTVNSRLTNVHRNVKSDMTNQWLRNVNLRKY